MAPSLTIYVILPWNYFNPGQGTIGVRLFATLTNESWVWGIFTSCSQALVICMSFVSTRGWKTEHHKLGPRVDQRVRHSASRPHCCSEWALAPPAVPFSVFLSTVVHNRVWLLDWGFLQVEGFWFSVVCGFKLFADSFSLSFMASKGAVDLLLNSEHTKKEWGTRGLNKCKWWSRQPFLKESLGRLTGSLSLHGFVLGKNKRVLCDLRHKALG